MAEGPLCFAQYSKICTASDPFGAKKPALKSMVRSFDRKEKFEKLLHKLKVGVLGRTIRSAADIAEEIDGYAARKLFGLSDKTPSYIRQFSTGHPKSSTTHINQMLLFVEALSFFWHAIDRLSFRQNSEELRAAVLDPLVHSLIEMLTDVLNKSGMSTTEANSLLGVQSLSLRYAGAPLFSALTYRTEIALCGSRPVPSLKMPIFMKL